MTHRPRATVATVAVLAVSRAYQVTVGCGVVEADDCESNTPCYKRRILLPIQLCFNLENDLHTI